MQLIYSPESVLSAVCLLFVSAMCVLAVLSHCVNDNLLERVGLAVLCLAAVSQAFTVLETGEVEFSSLLLHVGMAGLFAGSGWAKWRKNRRQK